MAAKRAESQDRISCKICCHGSRRDALIDLDGAVPENDISEKPRREHRDRDRRPRREHRE